MRKIKNRKRKKSGKDIDKNVILGVILGVFVIVVILLMIFLKAPIEEEEIPTFEDILVDEGIDVSLEVNRILDEFVTREVSNGNLINFIEVVVDENNNSFFTMICEEKIVYMNQHNMVINLADTFYSQLPEIYGKDVIQNPAPKINIVSGEICQYREGFRISKGYMGAMAVD
ncbi:hypothetical protein GOV12_05420 [Candidatus Pacearchaeota archaeon]|nr:hypothetical protein [Candidatus Pacearchaeota archaeon]